MKAVVLLSVLAVATAAPQLDKRFFVNDFFDFFTHTFEAAKNQFNAIVGSRKSYTVLLFFFTRPYILYGESIRFSLCMCLSVYLSVSMSVCLVTPGR